MKHSVILIGHRGSGKTVTGARAAELLGVPFVDLDEVIETQTGLTAAALVADNEEAFRQMEIETLHELLQGTAPAVISVGGGLREIPLDALVIQLFREGWDATAFEQRLRLRPGMSFEKERQWMIQTREPFYERHAHARLHIERGCPVDEAAHRLARMIRWFELASGSDALKKTWLVAQSDADLPRCFADAALLQCAGVELRSDLTTTIPEITAPYLASLRTEDDSFFQRMSAASCFDCDVELLDSAHLEGLQPRRFVISMHAAQPHEDDPARLLQAKQQFCARHPEWADFVSLKYAPAIHSWPELEHTLRLTEDLRREAQMTFLPQGKKWNWMRAFVLEKNEFNYCSPGAAGDQTPPGIQYFLPHCIPPFASEWYGVIGSPVDRSIGDAWHREQSLARNHGAIGYVKIDVEETELDDALDVLRLLRFKGLSVTAPLKRAVAQSSRVENPHGLEAGNTLTRNDAGWLLDDTDCIGMLAILADIEDSIESGPVAVFGRGGVTPALLAALEIRGWSPVTLVSAREGWPAHSASQYQLVVNAAGPRGAALINPPDARAWIDLHYAGIEGIPAGVEKYLNGMSFYEAQAEAQRVIWNYE